MADDVPAAESMNTPRRIDWNLKPLVPPRLRRLCPRCDQKRSFASTGKFRVNAHQGKVDVWLIYKCVDCDDTWKLTLFTRVTPRSIGGELYANLQHNDSDVAWRCAFDIGLISRSGAEFADHGEYQIIGPDPSLLGHEVARARIRIGFAFPLYARLEAVLSRQLNVSRRVVERLFSSAALVVEEPRGGGIPKKLVHETTLLLDLRALRAIRGKEPGPPDV